jgi:hypothetical protein
LNDLEILSADIQNAYLQAKFQEKIWTRAGPEFGSDEGSVHDHSPCIIWIKIQWRSISVFASKPTLCKPTKGDPDVWIRPAVKGDGYEYYEMVLVYVNDIFAISNDPMKTLNGIQI